MTALVAVIVVFIVVGIIFLSSNLLLGWLIRPSVPSVQKGEVYECGERPIGSAWIQFDLRFYVVALLFVIFDVEIAFFFPWAVVFGGANRLSDENLTHEQRTTALAVLGGMNTPKNPIAPSAAQLTNSEEKPDFATPKAFAKFAFWEMSVFFAILLFGFAYLWKRGDLEWVRSMSAQIKAERRVHGPPSPGME